MKILITGAGGFVGKAMVRLTDSAGHEVVGLVRSASQAQGRDGKTVAVDLGQAGGEADLVTGALENVDVVVHCAGRIRGSKTRDFVRDNVDATAAILKACRRAGVRRLVHVGSTAVYGDRAPERGPVTEDSPTGYRISRLDPYSTTKLLAEELVLRAMAEGDLEIVSVRPGWIIGRGAPNLLPLARRLGAPVFPLVGQGQNRLPITSTDSVTQALLLAATNEAAPGRVYNVAQDEELSQRNFFEALAQACGAKPRFLPVPPALLQVAGLGSEIAGKLIPGFEPPITRNAVALLGLDAVFPTDRIRHELGWEPAAPIAAVLQDALDANKP
jgi:nucleoside-diphosphate-sugar epimerase